MINSKDVKENDKELIANKTTPFLPVYFENSAIVVEFCNSTEGFKSALLTLTWLLEYPEERFFKIDKQITERIYLDFKYTDNEEIFSEEEFFEEVGKNPELIQETVDFLKAIIKNNADPLETLYSSDEVEAGSYAARVLVLADAKYLPLYKEYLEGIDPDHTVDAQLETIEACVDLYSVEVMRDILGKTLSSMNFAEELEWVPEWE